MYTTIKEVMEAQLVTLTLEVARLNEVVVVITDENEARKLLLQGENATIRVLNEDVKSLQDTKMGIIDERNRLRKVNDDLQRQLNYLYRPAKSTDLGEVKIENAILTEVNDSLKAKVASLRKSIEGFKDEQRRIRAEHGEVVENLRDANDMWKKEWQDQVDLSRVRLADISQLESRLEVAENLANLRLELLYRDTELQWRQKTSIIKLQGKLREAEAKIPVAPATAEFRERIEEMKKDKEAWAARAYRMIGKR
jgi:hypothetical protein